jgi:glutathione S-transferase
MAELTLLMGNKNYSSWSLRPWLALKQARAPFKEMVVPLYEPGSASTIAAHSPSRKVPALRHGDLVVWDSLAICEYVSEQFPDAHLWPEDAQARAVARSISAEMHSGFAALRQSMPMNVRARRPGAGRTPESIRDIERIRFLWHDALGRFGRGGPFLFGAFTIADAMFAPVVLRFRTYEVSLDARLHEYCSSLLALPAMEEWLGAAQMEPWTIEAYEYPSALA